MRTTNPFPGMNPYLEAFWPGVHTRLIAYICDAIAEQLPSDLSSRAEEEIAIEFPQPEHNYRADVAVIESTKTKLATDSATAELPVAVSEPVVIEGGLVHRWVEIREEGGRLVTVIEVLSPSNKRGPGWMTYMAKQSSLLASGINLVEIDLLRVGDRTLPDDFTQKLMKVDSTMYLIVATRGLSPNRREIYYAPFSERLPVVRVPLRPTDRDVVLDIQPLIDRCYESGRYWQDIKSTSLTPPLQPLEQEWSDQQLKNAGL